MIDFGLDAIVALHEEQQGVVQLSEGAYLATTPSFVASILANSEDVFVVPHTFVRSNHVRHLDSADVDHWLSVRNAASGVLRAEAVALSTEIARRSLNRHLARLYQTEPVNAVAFAESVALDWITEVCLGAEVRQRPSLIRDLHAAVASLSVASERRPRWALISKQRLVDRRIRDLDHLITEVQVQNRVAKARIRSVTALLEVQANFSPQAVREFLPSLLLAGYSSLAALLAWTLVTLGQNPRSSDCDVFWDTEEGDRLVVRELMRLYPPSWLISRTATRDVERAGVRFRAGDVVFCSPFALQRSPRYYTDADAFSPDRWLDRSADRPFLPFGAGNRACPGAAMATAMLRACVAELRARRALVDVLEPSPLRFEAARTLKPSDVLVRILDDGRPRSSSCASGAHA